MLAADESPVNVLAVELTSAPRDALGEQHPAHQAGEIMPDLAVVLEARQFTSPLKAGRVRGLEINLYSIV